MIEERITYLGFLGDPNDLSMAFLMTLPLTLYVAKVSGSFIVRIACYASAGLVLYAIYLCNSRGSMLGLLAMVGFYAIQRFGWLRSVVVAPMLLIPLLLLAPSRISEISADEDSAAGRIDAWYEGFEMFRSASVVRRRQGPVHRHTIRSRPTTRSCSPSPNWEPSATSSGCRS